MYPITDSHAQVTIGSSIPPVKGSLLDLKENISDTTNVTSTRGLMLPRVELSNPNELILGDLTIDDSDDGGNQKLKHTGLIVYNVNDTQPFCKGIYAWDGTEWIPLQQCVPDISIDGDSSSSNIFVASGQDLRPLEPMTFTITWKNDEAKLSLENVANNALYGKVEYVPIDFSTLTSPAKFDLSPVAMTADDVSDTGGNPFKTNISDYVFSVTDGTKTTVANSVTVNQTNKALTLDGKYIPEIVTFKSPGIGEVLNYSVNIQSNAKWKVKSNVLTSDNIESIAVDGTTVSTTNNKFGGEREDSQSNSNTLDLTLSNDSQLSSLSIPVVLSDTSATSRFNDLSLTIFMCVGNSAKQRTMLDWVNYLGFTNVKSKEEWKALADDEARTQADANANIDIPQPISGIAWHRDQSGNIFLSGSFVANNPTSNENRWMITNLAATEYDTKRTDGTTAISAPTFNVTNTSETDPYISYPKTTGNSNNATDVTVYNNNPRIGLLYNWAAATMQRTYSSVDELETDLPEIQGICPCGWHLPSNKEFTDLVGLTTTSGTKEGVGEIPLHYSTYSKVPDGSSTSVAGRAVKEACEQFDVEGANGQSNPISPDSRAGMNWVLAGFSSPTSMGGTFGNFGYFGALWTSSKSTSNTVNSVTTKKAYERHVWYTSGNDQLVAKQEALTYKMAVRCKKNKTTNP